MKFVCLILLIIGSLLTCRADTYKLEGEPFVPIASAKIIWGISVTNLPSDLWVYQVLPGKFAPSVFSNLLSVSQLKVVNSTQVNPYFKEMDPDFMTFEIGNEQGRIFHSLNVAPSLGWAKYFDNTGNPKDPLLESLSENQTKELGKHYMFLFGIDRSLYDPKPRLMTISTTTWKTQTNIITSRGVAYSRRIDGIDEKGSCFYIEFGGCNKVMNFEMNWRNLVPYKSYSITGTNEIIESIKSGQARVTNVSNDALEKLFHADKLTITRFDPIYFSRPGTKKIGFEFPYAEMTVQADYGTNQETVYMNCPLIK